MKTLWCFLDESIDNLKKMFGEEIVDTTIYKSHFGPMPRIIVKPGTSEERKREIRKLIQDYRHQKFIEFHGCKTNEEWNQYVTNGCKHF